MKYLFLTSWLRAREKKLVDNVDLDRMIGATTIEESFKVLNDTDYAPYLVADGDYDIEKVIERERKGFHKMLSVMGVEEEVLDIFFLRERMDLFLNEEERQADALLDIYFEKVTSFLRKEKEKQALNFFENYRNIIKKSTGDYKKRDELLLKMEKEIVEKEKEEIGGLIPALAFLIKKRRAEYYIRTIFACKRIGVDAKEIYKLIKEKRAL
jgi:vacuolar-type H+-ATPase subunit C/Vma6